MELTSDNRIDPNLAAQLLLDLAREQSLENALHKFVSDAVLHRNIGCLQIWLISQGDRCSACPLRERCIEQSRCLHLVAGAGVSVAGTRVKARYLEDRDQRIPIGVGPIGKAAASAEEIPPHLLEPHEQDMTGVEWIRKEQIHIFGVLPIVFKGQNMGVMAFFVRTDRLKEEDRPWGRILVDYIAAVVANARAFEEIQRLKVQLELHNTYLQEEVVTAKALGDLVGQSEALHQVVHQIDLVAPTEASVLIFGETGTGKELVAHEIHLRSRRKPGPLVRVNCASIPKDLFESELFGHVRGAFTGAVRDRAGRFETAEGGTLFLDEIGELPLEVQGKLLRVLQEKKYERVGDDRTRHTDVRIIAATNRDLKKAIAAGRFREDLYYRLHVFPINVIPLRERKDDIPLLAKHFIELSVKELKCATPRLTRAGVAVLLGYAWPGNVRELRNVIERAVILARGGTLNFDLPVTSSGVSEFRQKPPSKSQETTTLKPRFLTQTQLRCQERENILAALEAAHWRIRGQEGAADLLGVKPTTLYWRMRKMGITRPGCEPEG